MSAARRALDGLDDRIEASIFYDASLCLSELVTNAVLHSGAEELELRVDVSKDLLRVTVADDGSGFDPGEPSSGDESGWGLYIVDRLSHAWGVDRGDGTQVWFEMRTAPEAPARPSRREEPAANEAGGESAHGARRSAFARLRPRTDTV